jgi:phosphate transport system permease protein
MTGRETRPSSAGDAPIGADAAALAEATPSRRDRPSISRPPTRWQSGFNRAFQRLAYVFGLAVLALLGAILFEVMRHASTAMGRYGLPFLTTSVWDANKSVFGILPQIVGTLYTSLLALLFGGGLGITVALVLSQGFLDRRIELIMKNIIELLAAIPSVVYGLWGIFALIPALRPLTDWLHEHLGFIPFYSTRLSGPGILPASLVLSIMILPTVTAISREAMAAVPKRLAAAAYGLGATRWEVIFRVTIPSAAGGIFGSLVLGFGRALGETMALAMLVGNANVFGWSLFSPGTTLAALLANHFPEAGAVEVQALMYAAFILLVITLVVNALGSLIMLRTTAGLKGLS